MKNIKEYQAILKPLLKEWEHEVGTVFKMLLDEDKDRSALNEKFQTRSSEFLIAATTIWQEPFDNAQLQPRTSKKIGNEHFGSVLVPTGKNNAQIAGRRVGNVRDRCTQLTGDQAWVREFLDTLSELCFVSAGEAKSKRRTAQGNAWEKPPAPGVYVYSLQHYTENPTEPSPADDTPSRTLYKVGYSTVDAYLRATQSDQTFIPERPVLYRIYQPKSISETVQSDSVLPENLKTELAFLERKFHDHLRVFGHIDGWGGGTEWFLTSLRALDHLASLLDLHIEYVDTDDEED